MGGFVPIIDPTTGKITGYKTTVGGADTVFPFSSVKSEKNISIAANERVKINLGFKPKYICVYCLSNLYSSVYIFNRDISDTSQIYIWAQVGYQNGGTNTALPIGSSYGFYDITDDGFFITDSGSRASTMSYFAVG